MDIKHFVKNNFSKLKHHFDLAWQGKEDLVIVLWIWGGLAYLLSFIINKILILINIMFIKWIISLLVIAYFIVHIFIIKKCSPKKLKLSVEEKEKLKKDRFNRILRKLLLKEPITTWNPSLVATLIDIYVILCFANYLLR